jgi:cyclopropane-fatty-acyl-phospholipid synthase
MTTLLRSLATALDRSPPYGPVDRALRARLLGQFAAMAGRVEVEEPFGTTVVGRADAGEPLHARLRVHDPGFYRAVAWNGSVGGAEAYIQGLWDSDDLVTLVRLLVRNRDLLDGMDRGLARVGGWAMEALDLLRRPTRRGSRANVRAHYDIGNEFFRLFLDDDMMYSSALFAHPDEPLEVASRRKLARICDKLDLRPHDRVLEIGSGWGGLAVYVARERGCRVTTTTISRDQYALARERVAAAGLTERVTVLHDDYRDLRGRFDKVVSVEMIEAVGEAYLETFLRRTAALLEPHGLALIQAITIEDHRYRQALGSVDFIRRHVFPGSFIPSVSAIVGAAARATDLRLVNLEDIGPSYALTLRAWRQRFLAQRERARALGYDERFLRLWEFYLCYCEGGFLERSISDAQLLFARPGCRRGQLSPPLG